MAEYCAIIDCRPSDMVLPSVIDFMAEIVDPPSSAGGIGVKMFSKISVFSSLFCSSCSSDSEASWIRKLVSSSRS